MSEHYVKSRLFPLPSVELDLEKSEKGEKKILKSGKLPSHLLLCRQAKPSVTNSILPNTVIMSGRYLNHTSNASRNY